MCIASYEPKKFVYAVYTINSTKFQRLYTRLWRLASQKLLSWANDAYTVMQYINNGIYSTSAKRLSQVELSCD